MECGSYFQFISHVLQHQRLFQLFRNTSPRSNESTIAIVVCIIEKEIDLYKTSLQKKLQQLSQRPLSTKELHISCRAEGKLPLYIHRQADLSWECQIPPSSYTSGIQVREFYHIHFFPLCLHETKVKSIFYEQLPQCISLREKYKCLCLKM